MPCGSKERGGGTLQIGRSILCKRIDPLLTLPCGRLTLLLASSSSPLSAPPPPHPPSRFQKSCHPFCVSILSKRKDNANSSPPPHPSLPPLPRPPPPLAFPPEAKQASKSGGYRKQHNKERTDERRTRRKKKALRSSPLPFFSPSKYQPHKQTNKRHSCVRAACERRGKGGRGW